MLIDTEGLNKKIRRLANGSSRVIQGVDRCPAIAEIPKGRFVQVSQLLIEGVHFDLSYMNPRELGHKSAVLALSSFVGSGAQPLYVSVSLGVSQGTREIFVMEFYRGLQSVAKKHKVDLLASHLRDSPSFLVIHVTCIGEVKKKKQSLKPRVGDKIAYVGVPGLSIAGLEGLKHLGRASMENHSGLLRAHVLPIPRIREANALVENRSVSSVTCVQNGLSKDVHDLLIGMKGSALLFQDAVPIDGELSKMASLLRANPLWWALYGPEDYQLLITFSSKQQKRVEQTLKRFRLPIFVVGEVRKKGKGVRMQVPTGEEKPLPPRLWHNFVRRSRPDP